MTRQTKIFIVDAGDVEAVKEFRVRVNAQLAEHPDSHLTWLQSGSTNVDFKKIGDCEQGRGRPRFLLTCVAEFDADTVYVEPGILTPEKVVEDIAKALAGAKPKGRTKGTG